jgi:hypothetical protein
VLLVVNDHYRTNSSVLGATHIAERLGLEMNDENLLAVGTALRSLLSRGALSGIDPKTAPDSLPKIIVMGMTSRGEEMAEGLAGSGGVTAEFLLAEAKFVVEKKIAAIKDLEAKASAQLDFRHEPSAVRRRVRAARLRRRGRAARRTRVEPDLRIARSRRRSAADRYLPREPHRAR